MTCATAPDPTEASEYFFKYIDLVAPGDICDRLDTQREAVLALIEGISDERSQSRYAPDKWSLHNPFTVRALAWITVGHVAHHVKVVRERDLPLP